MALKCDATKANMIKEPGCAELELKRDAHAMRVCSYVMGG